MNLFNLFATITADTSDYKKAVNDAEDEIEQLSDTTDTEAKKMDKSWSDVGKSVGDGLTTASGYILGFATALGGISVATEESRQQQILLDTAFTTNGKTVEQAEATYKDFYGLLGDEGQAIEAVSFLAKMTSSQEELTEWTRISAGVYSQFGNSLPLEGLAEATNETAKVGAVTGTLADALNWAGISEDAFNEKLETLATEEERLAYITETLSGEYGALGDTYTENNKSIIESRDAQVELSDAMNTLGEKIAPIVTQIMVLATEWIPKLTDMFIENKDVILPLAGVILGLTVAYKGIMIINSVVQAIKTLNALMDIQKVKTLALNVVTGVQTGITYAQTAATWLATTATTAFGTAMAILTSPITLIILAITALIGIIYLLITNWDTVKQVVIDVWNKIVESVKSAIDFMQPFIQGFIDTIMSIFGFFVDWFVASFMFPINSAIGIITSVFEAFMVNVNNIFGGIQQIFQGLINFVTGVFTGNWSQAWNGIVGIFSGIFNTIIGIAKAPINGVIGLINGMISVINSAIGGINSIGVDIPDWVPGIGGQRLGFSVPKIPNVPYLATGDVAKPNNEYLAVLGDNKREEEVISPLSTMKQAFNEELSNVKVPTSSIGNSAVLELLIEIRDLLKNQAIYLDGKTLVGSIVGDIDKALGILGKRKLRGV